MPKTSQKRPKNGQIKKTKNLSFFLARNYLKKIIQWAETANNGFKCFKMHIQIHIPQKGQKNANKW